MNNRKVKIVLRIYEFALILPMLLISSGIKTQGLLITGFLSLTVFILHWFLPNDYKRVFFALAAGFLTWFFWLLIISVLMSYFDLNAGYTDHSLWDLAQLAVPTILALAYGIWALVKRETEKITDRIFMGCLPVTFFIATIIYS